MISSTLCLHLFVGGWKIAADQGCHVLVRPVCQDFLQTSSLHLAYLYLLSSQKIPVCASMGVIWPSKPVLVPCLASLSGADVGFNDQYSTQWEVTYL